MNDDPGQPLATFRPTLAPICRLAFGLFIAVALIGGLAALMNGQPLLRTVRGLLVAAPVFAALVPLFGALVWPLGLSVYAEGIRGRTTWGRSAFIPWGEVSELNTHDASGMVFLIVKAADGVTDIWSLPDVVARPEFQRLVSGLAGSTNPLRCESHLSA